MLFLNFIRETKTIQKIFEGFFMSKVAGTLVILICGLFVLMKVCKDQIIDSLITLQEKFPICSRTQASTIHPVSS